jgi:hypothetical protein
MTGATTLEAQTADDTAKADGDISILGTLAALK